MRKGGGSSNGGGHLPHMFHTLNEKLFVSHSLSWSYHNHPPCFLLYILYFIIIWLLPLDIQNMLSLGFYFFLEKYHWGLGCLNWLLFFGGNLVSSDLRKIGEAKWTQRTKYITILFGNLFHFISFGKNHLLAWSHHLFNFPFFFLGLCKRYNS